MPDARPRTAAVILAAGASTRMGSIKQLAVLDGRPLVMHVVSAASAAGEVDRVMVVLGAHAAEVAAGLDLIDVQMVLAADWDRGTAATLYAGLQALAPGEGVVVLLGDQPLVAAKSISRVLGRARSSGRPARATYGHAPGHPLAIPAALADRLRSAPDPRGDARGLLAGWDVERVPCDDLGGGEDIDRPEQLLGLTAAPRAATGATASQIN